MARLSLAEYEAAISEEYAPLCLESGDAVLPFHSAVSSRPLGWMQLSKAYASSSFAGHRKSRSRSERSDDLVLTLVEEGRVTVTQHGRSTECVADTLFLQDCDSAMEAVQDGATGVLAFKMPKSILRTQFKNVDIGFGRAVKASDGCAGILRDLMVSIWRNCSSLQADEIRRLPSSVLNLVGLVFLSEGSVSSHSSAMAVHFERIEQAILLRIADPELSPAKIASELGISKSYLFAVANWGGRTFRRMVMEHRLDRCQQALCDPGEADRSITDIALGWGFQNVSHFSRCFVDRFGISPSAFRKQELQPLIQKQLLDFQGYKFTTHQEVHSCQ
ncbi:MAG: helix-turn-helix domain-containing protein [Sphingomonadaceae bacterium]